MVRLLPLLVVLSAILAAAAAAPLARLHPEVDFGARVRRSEEAHWGYEGAEGPAHWADLSEEWEECGTGQQQSPINLPENAMNTNEGELAINWGMLEGPNTLSNNGHTLQVDVAGHPNGAAQTTTFHNKTYSFLQFHLHAPSEHHLGSKHYPAELHAVHRAEDGSLLVVGIFVKDTTEASAGDFYRPFWFKFPSTKKDKLISNSIDLAELLALTSTENYWTYSGSLTTPPCTEGVTWVVLENPLEVGARRLRALTRRMDFNARITMPINERF